MYAIMGADWGRKKPEKMQLKQREQPYSPLSTPIPIPSPPPGSQITSSPAQVSPSKSTSNPDHYSYESNEQGFPLVQVAPSVEHLHAGHLGEVTKGYDSDLTNPAPPLLQNQRSRGLRSPREQPRVSEGSQSWQDGW